MSTDSEANPRRTQSPAPYATAGDVRELLESPGTQLVLMSGAVRVVPDGDDAGGGLPLIGRDQVVEQVGTHPAERQVAEQVAMVNTLIRLRGA